MTKRLLVDAVHPEEVRVVLADESKLIEFEFESAQKKQIKSNIYLGKITRVEPSLQAAFVEYGGNRQGFLPFSEIHYDYFQIPMEDKEKIKRIIEAEAPNMDDEDDDLDDLNNNEPQPSFQAPAAAPPQQAEKPVEAAPSHSPKTFLAAKNEDRKEFKTEEKFEEKRERNDKGRGDRKDKRGKGGRHDKGERSDRGDRGDRRPRNAEGPRPRIEIPYPFTQADLRDLLRAEDLAKVFALEYASEIIETYPVEQVAQVNIEPEDNKQVNNEPVTNVVEPINEEPAAISTETSNIQEVVSDNTQENVNYAPIINDNIEEVPYNQESFDEETTSINEDRDSRGSVMSRMDFYRQYKIQEVIKRNQVVLIQVVKEERGSKGASLTTYLAIAGRYCVFMPNTEKGGGVSRRISSFSERRRIRTIVKSLEVPKGSSIIVRTAGMERNEEEIKNDYNYINNLWTNIKKQTLESTAPALIYEESDIVKRSIRDLFKGDVEEVIIQGKEAYNSAANFVQLTSPAQLNSIKHHTGNVPLFQKFKVEERLDELYEREVKLNSGGSIVISPTEALVSIDVNSGRATKERNVEDTAYKTNIEAAREIARQLRLRDLAGLIVIDFIDMREMRNRKNVERELKDALRSDRARIQIGRISTFGLLEMSRQRIHSSIVESTSICCPMCNGTGAVRSTESMGLKTIRAIEAESGRKAVAELAIKVSPAIFREINEKRKRDIQNVETNDNVKIKLEEDVTLLPNQFEIQNQKGQKRKEKADNKGLSLEEFESLTPPHDANKSAAEGEEFKKTQYGNDTRRNDGGRNEGNRNRNRNRRNRNNRNSNNPNRNRAFGEANDNLGNNNYRDNNRGNYDNNPNYNAGAYQEPVNNVQKLQVEGSDKGEDKKSSSKLMGLWKKITS